METLRPDEQIVVIDDENVDPTFVSLKIKERKKDTILVFVSVSDDVAEQVLLYINPEDSGYAFFPLDIDVDPLNNNMVPRHRLATDEEMQKHIFDKYIPLRKLPILSMLDPIRRWLNFPKGSVIAIERPGGLYFRRVGQATA